MSMVPPHWEVGFPRNVWQLATIVNPAELERDGEKLAAIPAVVRAVSYEPAIEAIDWTGWLPRLNWVIIGGESAQGSPARPFNIQWAASTIEQCRAAGVAVFVKQLGSNVYADGEQSRLYPPLQDRAGADPSEWPTGLRIQEFPITEINP